MNIELQNNPNPDQVSVINASLKLSFELGTVSYVYKLWFFTIFLILKLKN